MKPSLILMVLVGAWCVFTAVLIVLLIYRATLSSKEDDQIFINAGEHVRSEEQRDLIAKMERLRTPIVALSTSSLVLFLAGFTLWLYQGLSNL